MILIRVISSDMISKPIVDLTCGKEAIVSKITASKCCSLALKTMGNFKRLNLSGLLNKNKSGC